MNPHTLTLNPVPTPAEREMLLERENAVLRMRVTVLTEALRAAEEELTTLRFADQNCEHASAGVVLPPHATIQGVFERRVWP